MDDKQLEEYDFGKALKEAREIVGITQSELAEKIGVSQKDLSRWETNFYKTDVYTLRKICIALGVSADFILKV